MKLILSIILISVLTSIQAKETTIINQDNPIEFVSSQGDTICDNVHFVNGLDLTCKVKSIHKDFIRVSWCPDTETVYEIKRDSILNINGLSIMDFNVKMKSEEDLKPEALSITEEPLNNTNSKKYLLLAKGIKQIKIEQGNQVFVKVGKQKYHGSFKISNDSTIEVNLTSILISDIDLIAKSNPSKTIGLILASLPFHLTGIVMMGFGPDEAYLYPAGGAIILGSIIGVGIEASRGKRYSKFTKEKKDGTIDLKWVYSIQTNDENYEE